MGHSNITIDRGSNLQQGKGIKMVAWVLEWRER